VRLSRFIGPLIVTLTGVAMCAWSWLTWPDPVIDFGREIYVPWRLAEGDVLYRDIVSYFNGPLSPYTHALLFRLFGPGLRVLVIFNLAVVAALAAMLYWLVCRAAGPIAATSAGVVFFTLFAFAQLVPTGNYNFICPYSYELPHGIALTAGGLVFLSLWIHTTRTILLAAAGVMLGLVFLTKAEVFLAAAASMAGGLSATAILRRPGLTRGVGVFLISAIIPPALAMFLLCLAMPPAQAARGIMGSWLFLRQHELLKLPYFRALAGTDDVPRSLATMLIWVGGYGLLFLPAIVIGRAIRPGGRAALGISVAIFAAILLAGLLGPVINWNNFIRPVPLLLIGALVAQVAALLRRRDEAFVLPIMLGIWSLVMLAKMPVNAHIYHYGFALAMPAVMVAIAALLGWLPRWIELRSGSGWPVRAAVLAVLLVAVSAHLRAFDSFWSAKTHVVGSGRDRFFADSRGIAVDRLVNEIERTTNPDQTLGMVPEGLLVNYLARRTNATGQLNFTPPALLMYGEDAMLEALRRRPPDRIVILHIDTSEYGATSFGLDYAQQLVQWIEQNYEPDGPSPVLRKRRSK
jgi:hypothetical protein